MASNVCLMLHIFIIRLLYSQNVSVCVSVLTLGAISIDRWYAFCNPLQFKGTATHAKVAIVIVWLISLAVSFPHLVWLQTKRNIDLDNFVHLTDCQYLWGKFPGFPLLNDFIKKSFVFDIYKGNTCKSGGSFKVHI